MRYFKSSMDGQPLTVINTLNGAGNPILADVSTENASRDGLSPGEFRDSPTTRYKLRRLLFAPNGEELDD